MFRLWIFIAQLLVATLALTFVMRGVVPYPIDVLCGFVGAILVMFAMSAFREAMAIARDRRALARAESGDSPKDGERVAVVGRLKAQGLPMRAPFTRRECVYYRYAASPELDLPGDRGAARSAYSGLAMTRCLVRDRTREIRLVGAPMFEGFESHSLSIPLGDCRENAERYVAETRFETWSPASDVVAHPAFDERDGKVRRDVRLDDAAPIGEMALREAIVPVEVPVCAIGTWSTEQAGLVQLLGTRELLTVFAGNAEDTAGRLARTMRRHLFHGGLSTALVLAIVAWGLVAR